MDEQKMQSGELQPEETQSVAAGSKKAEDHAGDEAQGVVSGTGDQPVRPKGKWFGRGIYGSKDVPIRVLDGLITVLIVVTLGMIIYFAVKGGFEIRFDTLGGSEVAAQKLRNGALVTEPEEPYKPGYDFQGWYWENAGEEMEWNFTKDQVTGPVTLSARWTPAEITVKFDLNGGESGDGETQIEPVQVVFGETYGTLPIPSKEGSIFQGWEYSGQMITSGTVVKMTGEHVLVAVWE